jgi:hypothetical protein
MTRTLKQLQQLVDAHQRRLYVLELQQARLGIQTDASILNEMETIKDAIAGLELEIKTMAVSPAIEMTGAILSKDTIVAKSERNLYTTKSDIDRVWQEMLNGATKSVNIFAGDVSWIDRDKELISRIIKDSVNIFVVCRPPRNEKTKQNVADLLETGACVRYYDTDPPVRGLLIDSERTRESTALIVDKFARQVIDEIDEASMPSTARGSGVPSSSNIYSHRAIRYLPEDDSRYVAVLNSLFAFYWETSIDSLVLYPGKLNTHHIVQALRIVPHYIDIKESDIQIELIDTDDLWAACTYVKQKKLQLTKAIFKAYEHSKIQIFSDCRCLSNKGEFLLLPPIIERHNGKYIIIDGMHRLFYAHVFFEEKQEVCCLILSTDTPPPSSPIPLDKVQIWPCKLPKNRVFLDYKPELLRKIKSLDQALKGDFHKLIGQGP